jgi:hypothetical protein
VIRMAKPLTAGIRPYAERCTMRANGFVAFNSLEVREKLTLIRRWE